MVGAYADLYPRQVAGLIFLDAAVVLPDGALYRPKYGPVTEAGLLAHLARIRRCLGRVQSESFRAVAGDECVDPEWYASMPVDLARAEIANRSAPRFWKAYLSEAECNYRGMISGQAAELLPHRWGRIPVRVVIAAMASRMDPGAMRENRLRSEQRQARVCDSVPDCMVFPVVTTDHLVHDADSELISRIVLELAGNSAR